MPARLEAWTSPPPAIRPSTPRSPRLNPTDMLERHRGKRLVFDCWFNQHGHVGFTCLHHEEFCQRREGSVCAIPQRKIQDMSSTRSCFRIIIASWSSSAPCSLCMNGRCL